MGKAEGGRLASARAKYSRLSERFKLGPHYTIERFGLVMLALTVVGVLVIIPTVASDRSAGNAVLGAQALYTTEFETSRTGVVGEVLQVYRSEDHRRAMVMMRFEDAQQMSANAEDYYVYGTGIADGKPADIAKPLAGQIYSFGNTGYLGVLLEAPEGFSSQLLNLTIRAKKELMAVKEGAAVPAGVDRSFVEHDQWRVVLNPAGSSAVWLRALDSEKTPSAESIYADAVIWPVEAERRKTLDASLATMKAQLARIDSLESEMATTSVRIGDDPNVRLLAPGLPREIEGDSISGLSATELGKELERTPADKIEGIGNKTSRARLMDTYSDGYLPNTYVLESQTTMPGGTDFDWRSRTVVDGYFETMGTGEPTVSDYLASLQAQPSASLNARDLVWNMSNGKRIEEIKATDTGAKPLIDLRNSAATAYADYFASKKKYQSATLIQLLVSEAELANVERTVTTASGPDAVAFRS